RRRYLTRTGRRQVNTDSPRRHNRVDFDVDHLVAVHVALELRAGIDQLQMVDLPFGLDAFGGRPVDRLVAGFPPAVLVAHPYTDEALPVDGEYIVFVVFGVAEDDPGGTIVLALRGDRQIGLVLEDAAVLVILVKNRRQRGRRDRVADAVNAVLDVAI